MDSTFCKVHQHAAGARKTFGNQNIGVSRGGKTTKIKVVLKVLADKAFCAEEIREYIAQEKAVACIPDKSNAVRRHDFVKELYKHRAVFFSVSKLSDTLRRVMINCLIAF